MKINSKSPWWIKAYVKIDHGFDNISGSNEKYEITEQLIEYLNTN